MDYFELRQSSKVENALEIMGLDKQKYCYAMTKADFEALDKLKVAYFSGREFEEICDVLTHPTFLISDRMKKLMELYEKESRYKGVQIFPTAEESKQFPLYWVPGFPEVDCFHKDTVILNNGMVKKLVLDVRKLGKHHIFRLPGLLEYKVIVSMPVAESILRRRLYGVELRKIEVA